MNTQKIDYADDDTLLEGYVAFPDSEKQKKPCVLVLHAWYGRDSFTDNRAEAIARLGYVGFAVDVYGKGVLGSSPETNLKLMKPFIEDRALLRKRLLSGLNAAKQLSTVDPHKIAVIGYCFGGLGGIDMARSGYDIKGVVSFHGNLIPAKNIPNKPIHAKILAIHGQEDPMVPPEVVSSFENEMSQAKADWQLHIYGNAKHGFTNPKSNNPQLGIMYDEVAEKRSWIAMQNFLKEVFHEDTSGR